MNRDSKPALRAGALARRASVDGRTREALAATLSRDGVEIARRFAGARGAWVSAFLPIRGEPDTLPLLAALAGAGLPTVLPVTSPRGEPLRFRAWRIGDPLAAGRFGTFEPTADATEIEPDVLFVPLSAFDRRGFRLGYGAGYYDGVLGRLREAKPILAIGVAFAAQEVAAVPTELHDQRLDAVITEGGLLSFGSL